MNDNIFGKLISVASIIIFIAIFLVIGALVVGCVEITKIKYNGTCKEMENWEVSELPARCYKEFRVDK